MVNEKNDHLDIFIILICVPSTKQKLVLTLSINMKYNITQRCVDGSSYIIRYKARYIKFEQF
jgi:hypothetical protein